MINVYIYTVLIMNLSVFLYFSTPVFFYDERCKMNFPFRDNTVLLYCIVSYSIVSYRIVSYRIVSYRIVSYRIVSYRIVSYRIVSYRIVSYIFFLLMRLLRVDEKTK